MYEEQISDEASRLQISKEPQIPLYQRPDLLLVDVNLWTLIVRILIVKHNEAHF